MPRRLSWTTRLPDILRQVENSPRSHYDRAHIETLFNIGRRAAQELLEALHDQTIGRSHLLSREALLRFLHQTKQQPASSLSQLALAAAPPRKRKSSQLPRTLVTAPQTSNDILSLPGNIVLSPGHLQVQFDSTEQLVYCLYLLSQFVQNDNFPQTYEPRTQTAEIENEKANLKAMFDDLEQREKAYRQRQSGEVSP